MGEHKQNSVSKTLKIMKSVSIALQDLDLVVAALSKSIGIRTEKGIGNGCKPTGIGVCTLDEGGDIALTRFLYPIRKQLLLLVWICFIQYGVKQFF